MRNSFNYYNKYYVRHYIRMGENYIFTGLQQHAQQLCVVSIAVVDYIAQKTSVASSHAIKPPVTNEWRLRMAERARAGRQSPTPRRRCSNCPRKSAAVERDQFSRRRWICSGRHQHRPAVALPTHRVVIFVVIVDGIYLVTGVRPSITASRASITVDRSIGKRCILLLLASIRAGSPPPGWSSKFVGLWRARLSQSPGTGNRGRGWETRTAVSRPIGRVTSGALLFFVDRRRGDDFPVPAAVRQIRLYGRGLMTGTRSVKRDDLSSSTPWAITSRETRPHDIRPPDFVDVTPLRADFVKHKRSNCLLNLHRWESYHHSLIIGRIDKCSVLQRPPAHLLIMRCLLGPLPSHFNQMYLTTQIKAK